MRIATVHSGICVLHPLVTARTAIHRIDTLFNVVVEVRAEGLAGHGYACAFTPEQANAIHALIRDLAAGKLL